ncbi:MAG: L-threonylcarbamoyladenylate synthase [Actinobacteria bacterium]|nr:L-threonylcarbamoyladenylate synthase [Actinomycetota bacterium]MCL5445990.1 L-threonylcarbamoyladenylate synthase [Actinomycetota bacterium]
MHEAIREAARIIRGGGLVSFPTETVYGLGADASNATAVSRIYRVKQRPCEDPLIVHISSLESIDAISGQASPAVKELASLFWPGPLTMVLQRSGNMVVPQVSGGRPTVAVRMPDHPVALAIIEAAGVPVAAPSANRFGHVSPTCAEDVVADLGDEVDMVIDAGPTRIGVESTVIDMTAAIPSILRPGGVTIEELRQILPKVEYKSREVDDSPDAPGRYLRHYAPDTPMVVVDGEDRELLYKMAQELARKGKRVVVISGVTNREYEATGRGRMNYDDMSGGTILTLDRYDATGMARNLYRMLRLADSQGADIILAGVLEETGVGVAVNDRLFRAAGGRVITDDSPAAVETISALATAEPQETFSQE